MGVQTPSPGRDGQNVAPSGCAAFASRAEMPGGPI
jgi:hypothetical protein